MKYLCLLAVLLTLPVTATAQQRRGDDKRSGDRGSSDRGERQRDERSRGEQNRPNRPSTTKFDPLRPSWEQQQPPWWERQGAPWWERGQVARPAPGRDRDSDDWRGRRRNYNNGGVVYVVPGYPYGQESVTTTTVVTPPPPAPVAARVSPAPPPPPPAIGFLNLEVEPRSLLQIYVDEVFIGTPADLGDELRLAPGTRKVELRARGHKPLAFSAEIVENRSINYRGTLERDPSAPAPAQTPAPAPAASAPTTMYMVPGCYLGNVAPKASELRPGCDISRMVTFRP